MSRLQPPFAGRVAASGFVIDVGVIGEAEARRRVLDLWSAGCVLRWIDDSRWLITLPRAAEVRCEHAPGLPLGTSTAGLAPAGSGQAPPPGVLRLEEGGRWTDRQLSGLKQLEPAGWIDLDGLTVHELSPVMKPAVPPASLPPPKPPAVPDLRSAAKIGPRSTRGDQVADRLASPRGRPRRAAAGRGGSGPFPSRRRGTVARLLLRSPAAPVIGRRHAKYLRELTEAFHRRQFDDALRDAVSLGSGGGFLTLRLPPRRDTVTGPGSTSPAGGGTIPWGTTVYQHLREMYRDAAGQLEAAGRIEEAAFVLADLMGNVTGAVAMLERHQKFGLAAEIADGRNLAAELVVRLRWMAGHHERAIEVARARGAYAAAVSRLEALDRDQARSLRATWAEDLRQGGDYLGAVEAAWPHPELRPSVVPDIQAGMALGGPAAAQLLAYLLAYRASSGSRAAAVALLRSEDAGLTLARDRLLAALSRLRCSDPAIDRELASEALRAMARAQLAPCWNQKSARRAVSALSRRADPVLRADLSSFHWQRPATRHPGAVIHANAPENAGQLPVLDAALVAGNTLLVAHGNHGARLLTSDGRIRARWNVPAHRLVVADHGGAAILATGIGDLGWQLHRLDLATRRLKPWVSVRASHLAPSFDGATLLVIDEAGTMNFLDAHSGQAKVLWRELHDAGQAVAVSRSPGMLSAIVRCFPRPGQLSAPARYEQWRWKLPEVTLRYRREVAWAPEQALTSSGVLLRLDPVASSSPVQYTLTTYVQGSAQPSQLAESPGAVSITASGPAHALIRNLGDWSQADVSSRSPAPADVSIRFPGMTQLRIRSHADTLTAWDSAGRIVAVDIGQQELAASMHTRL